MGQSFAISTNPPLTPVGDTPVASETSATGEYKHLLESFLDNNEPINDTTPSENNETFFGKIFTKGKVDPLGLVKQQIADKLKGAEQRLISIQNSAIRASTNTKSLSKGIKETFSKNANFINLCNLQLKAAYSMGGGNLGLVTSYKKSLSGLTNYLKVVDDLNRELTQSLDLLSRIESSTDLIYAELEGETNVFIDSIPSQKYINKFDRSKKLLNELLEIIEQKEANLSKFIGQIKALAAQLESRTIEVEKYLSGPKDVTLALKDHSEFTSELNILSVNLDVLNLNLLLLPTFSKTTQSIIGQLNGLETFINELEEINHTFVQNEHNQKGVSYPGSQTYNGVSVYQAESLTKV